jgi:hypothetical protein
MARNSVMRQLAALLGGAGLSLIAGRPRFSALQQFRLKSSD